MSDKKKAEFGRTAQCRNCGEQIMLYLTGWVHIDGELQSCGNMSGEAAPDEPCVYTQTQMDVALADKGDEATAELNLLVEELRWYGHTIAGGGPMTGYAKDGGE